MIAMSSEMVQIAVSSVSSIDSSIDDSLEMMNRLVSRQTDDKLINDRQVDR